ncbi:MAG TPA: F0F1 ATP synthase subunit alpha, partial [Candidatus Atribacteria bacterium]|nr:F0F1 ATP synthase subunit alpha [Candidatus Atribacteria bacterium]
EFAQYKELAVFSQFGSDLSADTLERLNHGERIMEVLKQPQYRPMPVEDQVLILYALNNKHLANIEIERIQKFQKDLIRYVDQHADHIKAEIRESGRITSKLVESIEAVIKQVKEQYNYS